MGQVPLVPARGRAAPVHAATSAATPARPLAARAAHTGRLRGARVAVYVFCGYVFCVADPASGAA